MQSNKKKKMTKYVKNIKIVSGNSKSDKIMGKKVWWLKFVFRNYSPT